jgi:hypothetical protein
MRAQAREILHHAREIRVEGERGPALETNEERDPRAREAERQVVVDALRLTQPDHHEVEPLDGGPQHGLDVRRTDHDSFGLSGSRVVEDLHDVVGRARGGSFLSSSRDAGAPTSGS